MPVSLVIISIQMMQNAAVMFPKTFIFQATIKENNIRLQKIQILLGYFLSSLSHMYSCQRTGYVHRIEVVERVQLLPETYQDSPTNQRKAHGKTKQHKQLPQPTRRQLIFCTLQLCSRCETILCPFSDAGASLNPLLRKLRNKQLYEIEKQIFYNHS